MVYSRLVGKFREELVPPYVGEETCEIATFQVWMGLRNSAQDAKNAKIECKGKSN